MFQSKAVNKKLPFKRQGLKTHVKTLRWVQRQNHDAATWEAENSSRMKQAWFLVLVTPWPSRNKRKTFMPQPVKQFQIFYLGKIFQVLLRRGSSCNLKSPWKRPSQEETPLVWGHSHKSSLIKNWQIWFFFAAAHKWHWILLKFLITEVGPYFSSLSVPSSHRVRRKVCLFQGKMELLI